MYQLLQNLDFLVLLVIGVKGISQAPLICSKTLSRLQHSMDLLVASNLEREKNRWRSFMATQV